MTTRTITAIYDSESEAQQARQQLLDHGLDDDDVRIVSHQLRGNRVDSDTNDSDTNDKGVWESIKDFFVGDNDRPMYSEGLRRGGCLLTARVTDASSDEAIAVLESTNAVDLDQRTEQWRAEGWSDSDTGLDRSAEDTAADAAFSDTGRTERAIPMAEERLRVGKREVDRGGVRVRSYVVEEPVREEVSLRDEHVEIERRPAQAAAATDDVFREQTIEVSERGEEALVAKDAVVTDELLVRKTAEERTETVEDSVRRTEVDIDDTRGTSKTRDPAGTTKRRSGRSK